MAPATIEKEKPIQTSLQNIANNAAMHFMLQKGYKGIEPLEDSPFSFVAKEDDTIVFVSVSACEKTPFPPCSVTREQFEEVASNYLIEHDSETNISVRADYISCCVFNKNRAFLRTLNNVFSNPNKE